MNVIDKTLYHQIHPFKLITDVISAFLAVYLFWLHSIVAGLMVAFIPSIVISLFMIKAMEFDKQKNSKLGKYVKIYMGRGTDTARSLGFLVMLAGGWFHYFWVIVLGFLVIIAAWMNGLVYPRDPSDKREMPSQSPSRRPGR